MNASRRLVIPLMVFLTACPRDQNQAGTTTAPITLRVNTTQRSSFQTVAGDTLSDSARILEIHPEQDGDALVVLFTDPRRRVLTGLAIVDRKMAAPQLLWPDSVTSVWWTGPHTLAFTTSNGRGIRLAIDIHAAKLRVADTSATTLTKPVTPVSADSTMLRRARAFTDSVRAQVDNTSQRSALTYSVLRVVPSSDGRMAAFYTAARDAQGILMNPAWYALDRESGMVTVIDQVTGSIIELPEQAGQWSGTGSFFYAKGQALWEAEIARLSSVTP